MEPGFGYHTGEKHATRLSAIYVCQHFDLIDICVNVILREYPNRNVDPNVYES